MIHPQFDPIAIAIGPVAVRWYGLMYLIAFVVFVALSRVRMRSTPAVKVEDIDNLVTLAVLGVVLGGRLGYVLFYKPAYYLQHPGEILAIWQGGMSFHGGFLGVLVVCWLFAWKKGWRFFDLMDFVAPGVPLGLGAGRLGNFINGELWGRPTDGPWAVIFPQSGDMQPRHPSQLYEFALEGLLLFAVLWLYARQPRRSGSISALFLLGYGSGRFVVEYAREPDRFLGPQALGMTMGQWLCVPMILAGVALWLWSQRQPVAWSPRNA